MFVRNTGQRNPSPLIGIWKLSTTLCGLSATAGMLKISLTFKNKSAAFITSFLKQQSLFAFFFPLPQRDYCHPIRSFKNSSTCGNQLWRRSIKGAQAASDPPSQAGGGNPGEPIVLGKSTMWSTIGTHVVKHSIKKLW